MLLFMCFAVGLCCMLVYSRYLTPPRAGVGRHHLWYIYIYIYIHIYVHMFIDRERERERDRL